jgi:predicted nucleic acid-binding protein
MRACVVRAQASQRTLREVLRFVRIWPLDPRVARQYAQLFYDLRRRGRVLSQVDLMVAALAINLNVTVLTTDRDFEAVNGISCENWIPSNP